MDSDYRWKMSFYPKPKESRSKRSAIQNRKSSFPIWKPICRWLLLLSCCRFLWGCVSVSFAVWNGKMSIFSTRYCVSAGLFSVSLQPTVTGRQRSWSPLQSRQHRSERLLSPICSWSILKCSVIKPIISSYRVPWVLLFRHLTSYILISTSRN